VLATIGSMYGFAARAGIVPEGTNPARGIEKFTESHRERFLTGEELERLGSAINEAETNGIPWTVDESKPNAKHLPKSPKRFTKIDPFAAAALRLLMFTGCRLREILNLRWKHVDLERGLLFLNYRAQMNWRKRWKRLVVPRCEYAGAIRSDDTSGFDSQIGIVHAQ
jgi:integrase